MKTNKRILLFCLLGLAVISASAKVLSGNCGIDGDNVTWSLDTDSGILVITGEGAMKDYNSSGPWCNYKDYIHTVEIKEGVTSIGGFAFYDCSSLTSISIPHSLTNIGFKAFQDCSSLTSVTIPNSVTVIGWGAFYGCSNLTSVTIPNSITIIEDYAFCYNHMKSEFIQEIIERTMSV